MSTNAPDVPSDDLLIEWGEIVASKQKDFTAEPKEVADCLAQLAERTDALRKRLARMQFVLTTVTLNKISSN